MFLEGHIQNFITRLDKSDLPFYIIRCVELSKEQPTESTYTICELAYNELIDEHKPTHNEY